MAGGAGEGLTIGARWGERSTMARMTMKRALFAIFESQTRAPFGWDQPGYPEQRWNCVMMKVGPLV
jgi:hypothetical protein